MGIGVLGPLTVDDSGALGRRDRIILEALVARSGRPVSSDQLADAVWGDRPPPSAAKNIQGCVVRLRKLLGPDAIVTSAYGYRLDLPADEVDVQRFERGVARSRELLLLREHDRAAFQLTEVLALWRGAPFGDLEGWAGAETEVRRLHELRLDAEELRLEAHLGAGRHREVLAEAERAWSPATLTATSPSGTPGPFACQMAGRDLTKEEWAQYLPEQPYRSVCPLRRSVSRAGRHRRYTVTAWTGIAAVHAPLTLPTTARTVDGWGSTSLVR